MEGGEACLVILWSLYLKHSTSLPVCSAGAMGACCSTKNKYDTATVAPASHNDDDEAYLDSINGGYSRAELGHWSVGGRAGKVGSSSVPSCLCIFTTYYVLLQESCAHMRTLTEAFLQAKELVP